VSGSINSILYQKVLGAGIALQAGRPRGRISISGRVASRPALGSTQPSIQWVPGLFPGGKAVGA
jgi:hypothetical protein